MNPTPQPYDDDIRAAVRLADVARSARDRRDARIVAAVAAGASQLRVAIAVGLDPATVSRIVSAARDGC
jgi:hypothetical protein